MLYEDIILYLKKVEGEKMAKLKNKNVIPKKKNNININNKKHGSMGAKKKYNRTAQIGFMTEKELESQLHKFIKDNRLDGKTDFFNRVLSNLNKLKPVICDK